METSTKRMARAIKQAIIQSAVQSGRVSQSEARNKEVKALLVRAAIDSGLVGIYNIDQLSDEEYEAVCSELEAFYQEAMSMS